MISLLCNALFDLENDAVLPALSPRTSLILEDIEVSPRKIFELIRSLDSNKAHGCDDVSIAMLKICDEATVLPLQINNIHQLSEEGCLS